MQKQNIDKYKNNECMYEIFCCWAGGKGREIIGEMTNGGLYLTDEIGERYQTYNNMHVM